MKFKSISEDNRFLDDVRYNPNTIGKHLLKTHTEKKDDDKKLYAAMSMFSLMRDSYSEAASQVENVNPVDIVKKMIENSKESIEEYSGEKYGL